MPGLRAAVDEASGTTRHRGAHTLAVVLVAWGATLVLGALLGFLWATIAPADPLFVAGGKAYPQAFQPRDYIHDDGIAAVLCTAAGLLVGSAIVVTLRRARGRESTLLALAVSVVLGAIGACAFWWVGTKAGYVDVAGLLSQSQDGDTFLAPVRLRMPGVLVLWPAASALVVFFVSLSDWWAQRAHERASARVSGPLSPT